MKTFDADEYEDMKTRWIDKKASEFINMIQSILVNDEFMDEIAESIAWSHYNDENCVKLFDAFGLQWNNSLCYLGQLTNRYEDEVDREFQEVISDVD